MGKTQRIRTLIVDDHAVVREGLRTSLGMLPDIQIVGEAASGGELFIAEKTVTTHISNILSKLGLADRTQAAVFAVKHGGE